MFRHIEQLAAFSYVHGDVDQRFADTTRLVVSPLVAIGALVLGGGSALVPCVNIYTAQTSDAVLDAFTVTAQNLADADGGLLTEQERELLRDCRQRADACMRQAPRTVYAALEAHLRQQGRILGAL